VFQYTKIVWYYFLGGAAFAGAGLEGMAFGASFFSFGACRALRMLPKNWVICLPIGRLAKVGMYSLSLKIWVASRINLSTNINKNIIPKKNEEVGSDAPK
jgi:hypothetical protein